MPVRLAVLPGGEVNLAGRWRYATNALSPARLHAAACDARWVARWVVASRAGELVGLLPIYRPKASAATTPEYEVGRLVPELADETLDHRQILWVGGCRDLAAGTCVGRDLGEAEAVEVRRQLVQTAFEVATDEGLLGIAPYVRDEESEAFRAGLGNRCLAAVVNEAATLFLPDHTLDGYLSLLSASGRQAVRRDWRQFDAAELKSFEAPADSLEEAAAALVVGVKLRHGITDHPRLAAMRLSQWRAGDADEYVAFGVRDRDGSLTAVCFGARTGDFLEMGEIGLANESPVRHRAYLDAVFYGPLRYALRHRCTAIGLGIDSLFPKARRGARLAPVWCMTQQKGA